jgi:hypothetical protein
MNRTTRTLLVKRITFNAGNHPDFQPPSVSEVLQRIWSSTRTAAETVWSTTEDADARRCFFHRGQPTQAGFIFEFCSYLPGNYPPSLTPRFDSKDVDISIMAPFAGGEQREYVTTVQVLVNGLSLIMEHSKGVGGAAALRKYLTHLLRQHSNDPRHPSINLIDAASRPDLHRAIARGGGVLMMQLPLVHQSADNSQRPYHRTLSELFSKVGGTDKVVAIYSSRDGLQVNDVVAAFEEADQDDEDELGCQITLMNGEKLTPSRYRIQKRISVPVTEGRNPVPQAVREEIKAYMIELLDDAAVGGALLTRDGNWAPDAP